MYRFTQDIILEISNFKPRSHVVLGSPTVSGEGFNPPADHLPDALPRFPQCRGQWYHHHGQDHPATVTMGHPWENILGPTALSMLGKEFSQAVFRGKK